MMGLGRTPLTRRRAFPTTTVATLMGCQGPRLRSSPRRGPCLTPLASTHPSSTTEHEERIEAGRSVRLCRTCFQKLLWRVIVTVCHGHSVMNLVRWFRKLVTRYRGRGHCYVIEKRGTHCHMVSLTLSHHCDRALGHNVRSIVTWCPGCCHMVSGGMSHGGRGYVTWCNMTQSVTGMTCGVMGMTRHGSQA